MAKTIADLDAALATLTSDLKPLADAVVANSAAIQALIDKINSTPSTADLTAEVEAVVSADQAVKDAAAAIAKADAPPAPEPPAASV